MHIVFLFHNCLPLSSCIHAFWMGKSWNNDFCMALPSQNGDFALFPKQSERLLEVNEAERVRKKKKNPQSLKFSSFIYMCSSISPNELPINVSISISQRNKIIIRTVNTVSDQQEWSLRGISLSIQMESTEIREQRSLTSPVWMKEKGKQILTECHCPSSWTEVIIIQKWSDMSKPSQKLIKYLVYA